MPIVLTCRLGLVQSFLKGRQLVVFGSSAHLLPPSGSVSFSALCKAEGTLSTVLYCLLSPSFLFFLPDPIVPFSYLFIFSYTKSFFFFFFFKLPGQAIWKWMAVIKCSEKLGMHWQLSSFLLVMWNGCLTAGLEYGCCRGEEGYCHSRTALNRQFQR